jgi:V/A-type H+-transporting ATPase subunit A
MPAEEGYPAYLPSRLAAFYERAGRFTTLGGREGSITLIGAVSPPGGDFSEPVTRHTQRFVRSWWELNRDLAHSRHYPAVDWLTSYSLYLDQVAEWWNDKIGVDWQNLRQRAMDILQEEANLQQLVQLVGPDTLAARQQWVLDGARLLREGFFQQNAFNDIDAYAVAEKQAILLQMFVGIFERGEARLSEGAALDRVRAQVDMPHLIRLRVTVPNDGLEQLKQERDQVFKKLDGLKPD